MSVDVLFEHGFWQLSALSVLILVSAVGTVVAARLKVRSSGGLGRWDVTVMTGLSWLVYVASNLAIFVLYMPARLQVVWGAVVAVVVAVLRTTNSVSAGSVERGARP